MRAVGVPVSGYYGWLRRPPSARSIRHVWLGDVICEIHSRSRQTYGAKRVHAELTSGRGITVCRQTVENLMRRAGLQGISGRPKHRKIHDTPTASDLVDRDFARGQPDRLWVTDITEHPTREGKIYCAVVLDTFSRRVVGWSIDSRATASLVTNALGMAIDSRNPTADETVFHTDKGTQPEFKWLLQHLLVGGGWVHVQARASVGGSGDAREGVVAGSAVAGASGASCGVLAGDRSGLVERGRGSRGRDVACVRVAVVSRGWRHAAAGVGPGLGPLSVVRRA